MAKISHQPHRIIVGLMSGTSLDGLDVACCKITGFGLSTQMDLLHFKTIPYSKKVKDRIRKIFAQHHIAFLSLSELHADLAIVHADMVLKCLYDWKLSPKKIDLLASHGQTVFHAPDHFEGATRHSTFQIVDGDHLAHLTGIITISDFRQKHIAAGGEGAPLSGYGDYLLCSKRNQKRLMLNIGGISNFTFLPGSCSGMMVTDVGPGNTLIDGLAKKLFNKPYDKNGSIATQGRVDGDLLKTLKSDPFFKLPFPKTTGSEYFNEQFLKNAMQALENKTLSAQDAIATITQLTVDTIVEAIHRLHARHLKIFVSGGGVRNKFIMEKLLTMLPHHDLQSSDTLGIPSEAKEAILFAVLANETIAGKALSLPTCPSVTMGKISLPH